ncbi:DNA-binding response regulator (plasmid) [Fulvitalea axinellae]|uniref:DNA-binding response regulator n=1 Tax=Fulvitalea axinellae TaxID=1182444 RepID=A0AAU9D6I9_9BACT|nr:DNA-binding response regulator [Fulvitalea axinellae]
MITCIIIEDQAPAQRILKKYIQDVGHLELSACFSDSVSALEYLKNNSVDLIFLDIHLPKISGLDFLTILPKRPKVILTTAYSEYALKGYELNVTDYLLKPFSFERFLQAVSKVKIETEDDNGNVQKEEPSNMDVLFVKSGHEHLGISVKSILYIRSELDYTEIFTENDKVLSSHSLRYWLDKMPKKTFTQVHKSYIVNVEKIRKVSGNQIFFQEGNPVPIGRTFRERLLNEYLQR